MNTTPPTNGRLARDELRASLFLTRGNSAGVRAALRNAGALGLSGIDWPAFTRLRSNERRLLLAMVRGPVTPGEAEAILPPSDRGRVVRLLQAAGLTAEESPQPGYSVPEGDRERLRLVLSVSSAFKLWAILPAGFPAAYPGLFEGESRAAEALLADVEPIERPQLVVLLFERLALHGCHIPECVLGTAAASVYQASPLALAREAGGREALAEVFAFAGVAPPWERPRQGRPLPSGEGRP